MKTLRIKQTDEFVNPVTGEIVSPSGLEQQLLAMLYGLSNVEKYYLLNELLKGLSRGRDLLRKRLLEELDEKPRQVGELVAYVRRRTQSRFDTKRFRKDHPELFREYAKEISQTVVVVEKPDLVMKIEEGQEALEQDMPL